jgi:hypothetical protein
MSTSSIFDKINEHRIKNNLAVYEKHPLVNCIDLFMKEITIEKLIEEFAINPNVTRSFTIPNYNIENYIRILENYMEMYSAKIQSVFQNNLQLNISFEKNIEKIKNIYFQENKIITKHSMENIESVTITINYKLLIGGAALPLTP